jgi:hypothetical protein
MLTLRQSNIGPPVYAHLLDYDVTEDGQTIGRIMEERAQAGPRVVLVLADHRGPPGRRQDVGLRCQLEETKAAFRASLHSYRAWRTRPSGLRLWLDGRRELKARPSLSEVGHRHHQNSGGE